MAFCSPHGNDKVIERGALTHETFAMKERRKRIGQSKPLAKKSSFKALDDNI
jgi:hypothetical protein